MKFGVKLIHSGPGASPENIRRWAQFAETLGLHLLMTADHVALTPEVQERYPAPYYEAFTNLAWIAGQTQKIKLGTSVIVVPYRDPIHLAHLTGNIDQLSGGRLILGVGVGWSETEFEAFRLPYHKRGAMTDDYLRALKTLWTNKVASHEGQFTSFQDVEIAPKPAQEPHPPIWVGGSSAPAFRRAVRFGQAWHPIHFQLDWLKEKALPRLHEIAEQEGKPVPALCPRIYCRFTDSPLPEGERMVGEGNPDQVHRDLETLEALGAEYVVFDTRRNSPTALDPRHNEEGWHVLTTLAHEVIDLEGETVR